MASPPTADLEDARPRLPDETAYGITYDQDDDHLAGRAVDPADRAVTEAAYTRSGLKRGLPVAP